MSRILLIIFPQQSHHNATFRLAKMLEQRGHSITYAAVSKLKSSIEGNGFMFFEIPEEDDLFPQPVPWQTINATPLFYIKEYFGSFRDASSQTLRIERKDFFSRIIDGIQPDLILIDGTYKLQSLQLLKHQIPYMFVETTVSTLKVKGIPPLSSTYIPTPSRISALISQVQWLSYHMYFYPLRPFSNYLFRRLSKKYGYPVRDLQFDRYFQPGYKSIPEINTSLPAFDFPRATPRNHVHVSFVEPANRNEIAVDWKYEELKHLLSHNHDNRIVFCSFGTAAWRYPGQDNFLKKIALAFQELKNLTLVMCVENDHTRRSIIRLNIPNVYVFRRVPQIDLLYNHADVMITHGGLNSVTECILTETPMLVYPGHKLLDQRGNAARVKYHMIGLHGSYRDSSTEIKKKVLELLHPVYLENISKLKRTVQESNSAEQGLDFIESYLKR